MFSHNNIEQKQAVITILKHHHQTQKQKELLTFFLLWLLNNTFFQHLLKEIFGFFAEYFIMFHLANIASLLAESGCADVKKQNNEMKKETADI